MKNKKIVKNQTIKRLQLEARPKRCGSARVHALGEPMMRFAIAMGQFGVSI